MARAVSSVLSDADLRAALAAGAQRQLMALDLPSAGDRLVDLVSSLV
jgi:hypothetical protein